MPLGGLLACLEFQPVIACCSSLEESQPANLADQTFLENICPLMFSGAPPVVQHCGISQRGYGPFVYRECAGWPSLLPYIRNACNPESVSTEGYLWSKYGGLQKMTKIGLPESQFFICSVSTHVSQKPD